MAPNEEWCHTMMMITIQELGQYSLNPGATVKQAWEWDNEVEEKAKDDDEAAKDLDGDEMKGEEL